MRIGGIYNARNTGRINELSFNTLQQTKLLTKAGLMLFVKAHKIRARAEDVSPFLYISAVSLLPIGNPKNIPQIITNHSHPVIPTKLLLACCEEPLIASITFERIENGRSVGNI